MLKTRKTLFSLLLIMSTVLFASCGNSMGDLNVGLGGEVIEDDDKIIVNGESNLMPESRVIGKVMVNGDEVLSEATELVDDKGRFTMELDHHQFGDAEVVVTFDFLSTIQEEEVREHYGEGGENLEGPFVYITDHWDAENIHKKAEVTLPLYADAEETTHTFSEPEWEEQPEDYGEPRVRIEIDDIIEDGEFFYVTGHSNLLEGSYIAGYYSDRRSGGNDTRVHPDGTFELIIDYHYSEEPYFTITFDPARQWESIREHYGYDGEKLVGNLVEQSSNSLYIEATFEYEHK